MERKLTDVIVAELQYFGMEEETLPSEDGSPINVVRSMLLKNADETFFMDSAGIETIELCDFLHIELGAISNSPKGIQTLLELIYITCDCLKAPTGAFNAIRSLIDICQDRGENIPVLKPRQLSKVLKEPIGLSRYMCMKPMLVRADYYSTVAEDIARQLNG